MKENWTVSWRPNEKAKAYLVKLGFKNQRNGKKKNDALNLNQVLNYCFITIMESHKRPLQDVVTDQMLCKAYLEMQKGMIAKKIRDLSPRMAKVNELIDRMDHKQITLLELEELEHLVVIND